MKIKEGFIKKKIMDDFVIVPTGDSADDFHGIIKLNDTGSFIWDKVTQGLEQDIIVKDLTDAYNIDETTAKSDVEEFIQQMLDAGCFEN